MAASSPLLMPKLGLTMAEGMLSAWHVRPGSHVEKGDLLFTVETDKIATDIEARGSGEILSLDVAEGATVPVGTPVGTWTGPPPDESESGDPDNIVTIPSQKESGAPAAPRHERTAGERIKATPLARRLADRAGIDLTALLGSGYGGRIKAADVVGACRERDRSEAQGDDAGGDAASPCGSRRPATSIERIIARRLTESKREIPHFYLTSAADMTQLLEVRRQLNGRGPGYPKLTVNHFIVAAAAQAIARAPDVNLIWDDGDLVAPDQIDIGIAVQTSRGLFSPVLRNVDALALDALAVATDQLLDRARAGGLQASELEGGIISISNVGMFGASLLLPIINPGQSAILGIGAIKDVFRPDANGKPILCRELQLALACDHRVMGGAPAAQFLESMRLLLENPAQLLCP